MCKHYTRHFEKYKCHHHYFSVRIKCYTFSLELRMFVWVSCQSVSVWLVPFKSLFTLPSSSVHAWAIRTTNGKSFKYELEHIFLYVEWFWRLTKSGAQSLLYNNSALIMDTFALIFARMHICALPPVIIIVVPLCAKIIIKWKTWCTRKLRTFQSIFTNTFTFILH